MKEGTPAAVLPLAGKADLLIAEKTDGKVGSFLDLYHAFHKNVRSLLCRLGLAQELEDLVQEVFLKAWRQLPGFEKRSAFKTWILKIALNHGLDELRRLRRRGEPLVYNDGIDDVAASNQHPETVDLIRKGLATLRLENQAVLILHLWEGYEVQEISQLLDIPEGTVKSRLHRGRQAMAIFLNEQGVKL